MTTPPVRSGPLKHGRGNFRYWPGIENENALGGGDAAVDFAGNPTRPAGATGDLQTINVFSDVNDPNRGSGISNDAYLQETLRRMPLPNDFTTGDGLNTAGITWVRRESGDDNAAGTSQDTNRKQLNVRWDYQITDSNKVNFVMSRERNTGDNSQPTWPGGLGGTQHRTPRIYSAQYTASVTPTVLNEFRFGYRLTNWHGRTAFSDGCCFGEGQFGRRPHRVWPGELPILQFQQRVSLPAEPVLDRRQQVDGNSGPGLDPEPGQPALQLLGQRELGRGCALLPGRMGSHMGRLGRLERRQPVAERNRRQRQFRHRDRGQSFPTSIRTAVWQRTS